MRKMWSEHKTKLVISSLLILVPIVIGLALWNSLPAQMISHWGADGVADGMASKPVMIFAVPLVLLVLHWVSLYFTLRDQIRRAQSEKAVALMFWVLPAISLIICGMMYVVGLEREINVSVLMSVVFALLFIVVGNLMPKVRRNRTIGIKIRWTLENEENWNRTHRFAGRLWVAGGFVLLPMMLLPEMAAVRAMIGVVIIMVLAPMLYSYLFYRAQCRAGSYTVTDAARPGSKAGKRSAVGIIVVLALVGVVMFTGKIEFQIEDTQLKIDASMFSDMSVSYEKIESIELRDSYDPGVRVAGVGSARLSMGTFKNEEFGRYILYSYTGADSCIVLRSEERVLVLAAASEAETQQLYEALCEKTGK